MHVYENKETCGRLRGKARLKEHEKEKACCGRQFNTIRKCTALELNIYSCMQSNHHKSAIV